MWRFTWRPDHAAECGSSSSSKPAYLDALAAVGDTTPCAKLFATVSAPVVDGPRRFRALRLGDLHDLALLHAFARGEFATAGFRNRDVRALIHRVPANPSASYIRRLSSRTSRLLRLLRAHDVIRKIPKTHRYRLTHKGVLLTTALFAARSANIKQLLAVPA